MNNNQVKNFSEEEVKNIKDKYIIGSKVKLLKDIEDDHPIKAGECGEIDLIDDIGTIHVDWDNGRNFGIIPGIDDFEVISVPEKIKVIFVKVGEEPVVKEIYNTLQAKQKEVGGHIECLSTSFSDKYDYDFIFNEEGKIYGLTGNRYIYDKQDVIAGDFLVSKANEEGEFVTLTDDECNMIIDKIKEQCPPAPPMKEYDISINVYMEEEIDR